MKVILILANCTTGVCSNFSLSGGTSRNWVQNGRSSCSDFTRHVSTMAGMSLHKTSEAVDACLDAISGAKLGDEMLSRPISRFRIV
jgi:hypothetical protein